MDPVTFRATAEPFWLGNQVAKCIGATFRPRVSAYVQQTAMCGQHGLGWHGAGVDAAHLALRGLASTALSFRRSYATVFVDIKAAFDSTVVAMALPYLGGQRHIASIVREHGFSPEEANEISCAANRLCEWGEAPAHLAHAVAALARDSWAFVDGSEEVTVPSSGVAPGLPWRTSLLG